MVSCVQDAVGDGIKQDITSQGLKTHNSLPTRIWDVLNTRLCESMNTLSCVANVTKRGSWELVPVFDKETGVLYTFMRESRFDEIKRQHDKGKNKNYYVTCLTNTLNADLLSIQTSLFLVESPDKEFMKKTIQKILTDLHVEEGLVKRHSLILFEGRNFDLISIRSVMINRNMEIVFEENWSKYILRHESVIMDSVNDFSAVANNPSRGLELTPKAAARKNKNIQPNKTTEKEING